MSPTTRRPRAPFRGAALVLLSVALAPVARAQAPAPQPHPRAESRPEAASTAAAFPIPESIRTEHERIHGELVAATKEKGQVGAAARVLADALHPHFVREEQIALPPLGLLAPLSRGERPAGMEKVLELTRALKSELPRMLEEHQAIAKAAKFLEAQAVKARNLRVAALARDLQLHAKAEEEVYYPAALVVGELVEARQGPR